MHFPFMSLLSLQTLTLSTIPHPHTSKRADGAAELAAKEAKYKIAQEERKQKEKIKALEEQHKKELGIQRSELECLQAEKDMEAVLVQDSIIINRLPMAEPTVFSGEPIHFIEWKSVFMSLIDQKGIYAADKLYYLKKYVSGPACKCLEGAFYRNDEEAYQDAWKKLNQRYGQAFVIQKGFREKLSSWTKIQSEDAERRKNFHKCKHACYVSCNGRWNGHVTDGMAMLMEGKSFPVSMIFPHFYYWKQKWPVTQSPPSMHFVLWSHPVTKGI